MAERCVQMKFRLYEKEGGVLVEGVSQFKYLVWALDQIDNYCPVVWRNVKRARRVWGDWARCCKGKG